MQLALPYNYGEPDFKTFATKSNGQMLLGKGSIMTSNGTGANTLTFVSI